MNFQNTKNILFVSDLPRETTSEDLEKLFSNYSFQGAELNIGRTSPWAKVYIETEAMAIKAKDELNGEILTPKSSTVKQWRPIRICLYERQYLSTEKNFKQSLLVKNLDQRLTQKEFYQIFLQYGEIDSAKIEYEPDGVSKGFGYIYYKSPDCAEKAKQSLNGKEYYGKKLDIVNLIPNKSKDFSNSLFVKNFPIDFQENDLKKLFEKYGEVKHVSISRDSNGNSKGFGFVAFSDFEMTSKCIGDMKQNEISFPGMPSLCVKYATRKEDREMKPVESAFMNEYLKVQFRLIYATGNIDTPLDFEKEIRLFIKVVMLAEYNPKEVIVDFNEYAGIVTFNNRKDFELYLKMYGEFCLSHAPSFHCTPIQPRNETPKVVMGINNQPSVMNRQAMPTMQMPMSMSMPGQGMNNRNYQQQQQQVQQNSNNNNNGNGNNMGMGQGQGGKYRGMPMPTNMNMSMPNIQMRPNNPQPFPNMQLVNNNNNEMQSQPKFIPLPNSNHNPNLLHNPYQNTNPNQPMPMPYQRQPMQLPGNMIIPPNAYPKDQMIPMPIPIYPQPPQKMGMRPPFPHPNQHNNVQPGQPGHPHPNYLVYPNPNGPMIPKEGFMPNPYMFNMDSKYNNNNSNPNINPNANPNMMMMGHHPPQPFQNRKTEEIDQRNLQNLDPVELQSIFNKPAQTMFTHEMMNNDDDEEIAIEIADSIYEIVSKQYPNEAAKITGMIKEMGILKMNQLLSKKEDLQELIDKGYEMIHEKTN